jgi:hypothetical protein
MLLRGISDLINLGHFDPITQMIPLTVIPLSSAHCISQESEKVNNFNYSLEKTAKE